MKAHNKKHNKTQQQQQKRSSSPNLPISKIPAIILKFSLIFKK